MGFGTDGLWIRTYGHTVFQLFFVCGFGVKVRNKRLFAGSVCTVDMFSRQHGNRGTGFTNTIWLIVRYR